MAVTLLSRTDKLHLHSTKLDLSRAKIAKHTQMCSTTQFVSQCTCQTYAASHRNHVNILRRPFQKKITYIPPYDIALYSLFISNF